MLLFIFLCVYSVSHSWTTFFLVVFISHFNFQQHTQYHKNNILKTTSKLIYLFLIYHRIYLYFYFLNFQNLFSVCNIYSYIWITVLILKCTSNIERNNMKIWIEIPKHAAAAADDDRRAYENFQLYVFYECIWRKREEIVAYI